MIMSGKESEVWNMLGKGIDERPCRSTWWVFSLDRPKDLRSVCVVEVSATTTHWDP